MIPAIRRKTTTKVKRCKVDPNVVIISSGSEDEDGNIRLATQSIANQQNTNIEDEINQPKKYNVVKKSTTINSLKRKRAIENEEFDKLVKQVFPDSVETIFLSDEETESTTKCKVPGCKSEEDLTTTCVRFVYSYHQVPYNKENPCFICRKCDLIAKEAVKERIIKLRNGELIFKVETCDAQPIDSHSLSKLDSIPKSSTVVLNPPVFNVETCDLSTAAEAPVQAEEETLIITAAFSISEILPSCQDDDDEICCDLNLEDFSYDMTDEAGQSPLNQVVDESSAMKENSFVEIVESISLESTVEDITSTSAIQVSPDAIFTEIIPPETAAEGISSVSALGQISSATAVEPSFINTEITAPEITLEGPSFINTEITAQESTVEKPSFINTEITAPESTVKETSLINTEITDIESTVEEPSLINTEITATESTVEKPSFINIEITAPESTVEEPSFINMELTATETTVEKPSFIKSETPETTVKEPSFINIEITAPESTVEEPSFITKMITASESTVEEPSFIKKKINAPDATVDKPNFLNTEIISSETALEENLSITGVQVPSFAIITEIIPPEPNVDEIPYTPTVKQISCISAVEVPSSVIFTEIIPTDPHFEDNTAEETLSVQDTEQNTNIYDCIVEPETEADICDYVKTKAKALLNKSNIKEQVEAAYSWVDENSNSLSKMVRELTKTISTMDVELVKATQELYSVFNPPIIQVAPLNAMDCTIDEDLVGDSMPTLFEALSLPLPRAFQIGTYAITPRTFIQFNQPVHKIPKPALPPYIKVVDRNNKPKPSVGEKFLVDSNSTSGFWVPCYIEQSLTYIVNKKRQTRYRIRLGTKKQPSSRWIEVELTKLAYFEHYNIKLDIGYRVVAPIYVNRVHGFYPGIIAELPTRLNKYRYLIFFERGMTSYILPSEVHSVVETYKKSYEYYNEEDRDFIKSYIESYPSRSMMKVTVSERVKVKHKGVWCNAKITAIDASIIKVLFLSTDHSEWIYRGSPRLYLIFEKLEKAEKARLESNSNKRKLVSIQGGEEPLAVQCEIISSDEEDFRSVTKYEKLENQSGAIVRAVAKKSTSRPIRSTTQPMPHYTINRRVSERRSTRQDNGRITRRYPPGILNPRLNKPHACSTRCVAWLIHDEKKTKGMNPLAIPSVYAFKRDTDGINITYVSPCGKRLENCEEVLSFLRSSGLPLTIDLFDFDPVTSIFDEFIVSQQYILMPDVSKGSEAIPIPCVNIYDETIPDLMEYMTERRGTEGVNLNTDPNFLIGCDCTDNCQDKSKCACWQQTIANAKAFNPNLKDSKIGYKNMKLTDGLISGIYECNNTCKCCKKTCMNRVVQRPLKVKLQLFKTKKKGWGTRCVNDIAAGSFICVYVGNILTESYANETGRTHGDEYFAELDFIEAIEQHKDNYEDAPPEANYPGWNGNDEDEELIYPRRNRDMNISGISDQDAESDKPSVRSYYGPNESVFIMDAKVGGNIGRYLNHSCDPNIFVQNVFVDTHDLRFPWVSFFSMKHIPAGTELTWHYGYSIDSVPGKKLFCYCEAPNCKRRLL